MNAHDVDQFKVYDLGDRTVIHVPGGRAEELRIHLASHGVQAKVSPATTAPFERLEVEGGVDAETLQALVDRWER
jgi:hypothetical protein